MSVNGQPPAAGSAADVLAGVLESAGSGLAVLRGRDLIIESVSSVLAALAPGTELVGSAAADVCWLARRHSKLALGVLDSGQPLDLHDLRVRVAGATGTRDPSRSFTFRVRRVAIRGEEPRLWVAVLETTAQVRARRRTELLTSFSAALNAHPDVSIVVRRTLRRSIALLGARNGAVWLIESDGWTLRAELGIPIPQIRHERFDLRKLPTFQRALQARSATFCTRVELEGFEAELFQRLDISAGLVAPLVTPTRAVGFLTMSFRAVERRPDDAELAFATALAAQSALAIERSRAVEQARRTRLAVEASQARLKLLGDVGRILSSLDWESAIRATTLLAVGRLADWAILDTVGPGGALHREAVRCGHPGVRAPAWSPGTSGAAAPDRALEEAKRTLAMRCWELGGAEEAAVTASPHLASLRSAGAGAAILAPLVVRGEVLGVLTLARGFEMHYDPADVDLAQDLASLVALALHDARLLRSIEAAAEARDDILAMAKHELRTPVTVLALEAAQLARTANDDRTQRRADAIRRATSRLARAIEQLLDIAHIADGHPRLDREPLDLVRLVHQTMARVSPEVERVGCPIHLVAPDRLPASGDRLRIDGVVQHLFDQAARLGPGEPLEVVLGQRHGRAVLEVRYRGPPLPTEIRDRLAGPLERRAARRSMSETGVGLWIARWIVEAHGGRLLVHARVDGAAFVAEFPVDEPDVNQA